MWLTGIGAAVLRDDRHSRQHLRRGEDRFPGVGEPPDRIGRQSGGDGGWNYSRCDRNLRRVLHPEPA